MVTLQVAGTGFEGTAAGGAIEGPFLVMFGTTGSVPEPVRLNATVAGTNTLIGFTTGRIEFSNGGATASCTSYQWYLQPR